MGGKSSREEFAARPGANGEPPLGETGDTDKP